ncbi:hypothetical protein KFE98_01020 [bacterium SCSIO 12741]|nr:hypothetical protein KFE98_01020 [bacterium SCSIO 12741]
MRSILWGCFLLLAVQLNGQESAEREALPWRISYYGNFLTHPGIKLGMDWHLIHVNKEKIRGEKTKNIHKYLMVTPSIAFYTHPQSHKGLLIAADLQWNRYGKRGFYTGVSAGIGYYTKFNSGETLEVSTDGSVKSKSVSSRGYFTPSIGGELGQRFKLSQEQKLDVFTRMNGHFLLGYNSGWVPELAWELGIRYAPFFGPKRTACKTVSKSKGK